VNRTIEHWNQLPAEILEILPGNSTTFRKMVRKVTVRGALREVKVSRKSTEVYWEYEKKGVTKSALREFLVFE
jgi:hypothetical protein